MFSSVGQLCGSNDVVKMFCKVLYNIQRAILLNYLGLRPRTLVSQLE